jgi:hypothetical protein
MLPVEINHRTPPFHQPRQHENEADALKFDSGAECARTAIAITAIIDTHQTQERTQLLHGRGKMALQTAPKCTTNFEWTVYPTRGRDKLNFDVENFPIGAAHSGGCQHVTKEVQCNG